MVRHLRRVEHDTAHAVDHVQQQWQLKRSVDAGKLLRGPQVCGPQSPDVRCAESRYAQVSQTSGPGASPTPPPRVLGLVDQVLYVLVDPFQPNAQCQARDVEKLFDHDAIDVGQEREQAYEVPVIEPAAVGRKLRTKCVYNF